jgi:hypothetical protein
VKNVSRGRDDIVYCAGFFEGEGSVRIQNHGRRSRCLQLQVTVVQATLEPLDLFKKLFGGSIARRQMRYRGGYRNLYTWVASSKSGEIFLRTVYPYLRIKKEEARIALQYRDRIRDQTQYDTRKRLSENEVAERMRLAELIKTVRKEKRAAVQERCVAYV